MNLYKCTSLSTNISVLFCSVLFTLPLWNSDTTTLSCRWLRRLNVNKPKFKSLTIERLCPPVLVVFDNVKEHSDRLYSQNSKAWQSSVCARRFLLFLTMLKSTLIVCIRIISCGFRWFSFHCIRCLRPSFWLLKKNRFDYNIDNYNIITRRYPISIQYMHFVLC